MHLLSQGTILHNYLPICKNMCSQCLTYKYSYNLPSHRGAGIPCICGAGDLQIDYANKEVKVVSNGKNVATLRAGDWISINGDTGEVLVGKQPLSPPSFESNKELSIFMAWVRNIYHQCLTYRLYAHITIDNQTSL